MGILLDQARKIQNLFDKYSYSENAPEAMQKAVNEILEEAIEKAISFKQSSSRVSTIAAKYMNHEDPNVRSLAASVLSQDRKKGQ